MEYVEGETLQQRLEKGRLPLDQALEYAIQIADALDKAHRQGVVHRDFKPGNIMLTKSGTKLLDFGLAKLRGAAGDVSPLSQMPTQDPSAPLTAEGTILGTLQYMAPEQLEGKEADARTDIFAFGAVVYEMVTGKNAFEGTSQASLIGAIMNHQPSPVAEVQPVSPPLLDHVINACLAKNPEDRCQTAMDLMRELKWVVSMPVSDSVEDVSMEQVSASWRFLPWAVTALMLAIAAAASWNLWRVESGPGRAVARLVITLPDGQRFTGAGESFAPPVAVSPDRTQIVYAATEGGLPQLYRRSLDEFDTVALPGTEGATSPVYSPDGRWIAFHANGRLQRVPLEGGPPVTICEAPNFRGTGMDWTANGEILFTASGLGSGLFRVPASGGTPEPLTTLDVERGEYAHSWPQLLPDGRHVLFSVWKAGERAAILSLDTLEWHEILPDAGGARFIPTGHIVYRTPLGSVEARAFDADTLNIVGDSVPLADRIDVIPRAGSFSASVSASGVLVYVPVDPRERTLVWVNRQGQSSEVTGDRGSYEFPRVSPDGTRVSFQEGEGGILSPWVIDLERGTRTRITTAEGFNNKPEWTPDGTQISFANNRTGPWNLYSKLVDGDAPATPMLPSDGTNFPYAWSPNGQLLAFSDYTPETAGDIWIIPTGGDAEPFIATRFEEGWARFSRDGRFIAYASNESGRFEVYVQPYPVGQRVTISTEGGVEPVWSPDGRELFYRQGDTMMIVDVSTAAEFQAGRPRELFVGRYEVDIWTNYDISADGERFLMVRPDPNAPRELRVVLNWFQELRERVPVD